MPIGGGTMKRFVILVVVMMLAACSGGSSRSSVTKEQRDCIVQMGTTSEATSVGWATGPCGAAYIVLEGRTDDIGVKARALQDCQVAENKKNNDAPNLLQSACTDEYAALKSAMD